MPLQKLFFRIMEPSGRILYWFREPALIEDISCLCQEAEGCHELVPVFCFDSREGNLTEVSDRRQKALRVAQLREDLKSRGSNILVVYNFYEVIIPSLARVLKVSKVLTHPLSPTPSSKDQVLTEFREEKLKEVGHFLNMHSIDLKVSQLNNITGWMPLPVFPSINPGQIRL